MSTTPSAGTPRQPLQGSLQELNRRKRGFTFTAAISVLGIFLLLPILAAFTPVLDPIVFSGVSLAYLFGFAMFVVALVVAHIYQSRAKRLDVLTERARTEIRERGEP